MKRLTEHKLAVFLVVATIVGIVFIASYGAPKRSASTAERIGGDAVIASLVHADARDKNDVAIGDRWSAAEAALRTNDLIGRARASLPDVAGGGLRRVAPAC